jgi:hypothetical protein
LKRWSSIAALAIGMLVTWPAAADLTPKEEAKRTQLFKEGKALGDAGQWKEAAEKFRAVVELRSAPKALIALAFAEEKSGRLSEAKRLYEKAREDAVAAKLKADEEAAAQALRQLLPRVPRIAVKLPADAKDATILIDDKPAELQFGDADVDPGEHTVTVNAVDRKEFKQTVTVAEGERKEVQAVLAPIYVPPPPPPPETGRGPPPVGAIVLAGVGVGAGVAGAVLWGIARGKESEIEAMCGGIKECPATLKPEADAAATKIIVGDVLVAAGGAAIIGGGIWWLASGRSSPPPSTASAPRVTVSPTRRGVWASVEASF